MIKREDCIFTIECLEEDQPIKGNVMASGDDEVDEAAEMLVLDQLAHGNQWAWCTVRVVCTHAPSGITGDNYLGCCSYKSEEDFRSSSADYFNDMCADAFDECAEECERIRKALEE